ncbi:hypothetical protein GCM10018966_076010 [Streptomyces yanii]
MRVDRWRRLPTIVHGSGRHTGTGLFSHSETAPERARPMGDELLDLATTTTGGKDRPYSAAREHYETLVPRCTQRSAMGLQDVG